MPLADAPVSLLLFSSHGVSEVEMEEDEKKEGLLWETWEGVFVSMLLASNGLHKGFNLPFLLNFSPLVRNIFTFFST